MTKFSKLFLAALLLGGTAFVQDEVDKKEKVKVKKETR